MQSIQELFKLRDFTAARSAVIQKLRHDKHNDNAMADGYTEHWPAIHEAFDLLVLAFESKDSSQRTLYAGFLTDTEISHEKSQRIRLYADRFVKIGVHDRAMVSDARFYGTKGGGGSRVKAYRNGAKPRSTSGLDRSGMDRSVPPGAMEQRMMWVRKHHAKFRDPVVNHWGNTCAVYRTRCNGLLVASHIYPWHRSNPTEKTDFNNGLLLSAPLDRLFDRGLISFADSGEMLVRSNVEKNTMNAFGLAGRKASLEPSLITSKMREYLARHRKMYGF